jgi:hypothetical protein
MSFAFFLVFVIYVYDLRDISDTAPRQAATPQQPANLPPVLPPPDPLRAVEAPPPSELLAAPSTGR